MSKIMRRLATGVATLAVAGGAVFVTGGAASATTIESVGHSAVVTASHTVAQQQNANRRWDGRRWWSRSGGGHGHWYGNDRGHRYRYDGRRFYGWGHGKWHRLSAGYIRHHGFNNGCF